jgi:hypothetical protein
MNTKEAFNEFNKDLWKSLEKNIKQFSLEDLTISAEKNSLGEVDIFVYDPNRDTKLNIYLAYNTPNGDSDNQTEKLLIYGN